MHNVHFWNIATLLTTFRERHSQGHDRLCVCPSVPRRILTLLHGPGCNLGMVGVPSSYAPLGGLQSVHGFRCYDNIYACKLIALYTANAHNAEREMLATIASTCTR